MQAFGDMILEKLPDGRFQLSKPTIVMNFTKEWLEIEIAKIEQDLADKKDLLIKIEAI